MERNYDLQMQPPIYLNLYQGSTSTSSRQHQSMPDPKWHSKVAQFEQPIIAVKHVKHQDSDTVTDKKDYILCHVSFQSTGGTNIFTVNALSLVDLYVRDRSKGRGQQKGTWGIEMNEAREIYLKNHSAVDKIDQMLLGWDFTYRSWRCWHAPTRHAKAIAMSMAYSLYLQCAKGTVDPEWKVTPLSGPKFCQKMSLQMALKTQ